MGWKRYTTGDKNIIVYRGIKGLSHFLDQYEKIDSIGVPRIIELGFCSVTKNIQVTEEFVDKEGCCVN